MAADDFEDSIDLFSKCSVGVAVSCSNEEIALRVAESAAAADGLDRPKLGVTQVSRVDVLRAIGSVDVPLY